MAEMSFGGSWTLEKLNILGRYLDAYTTALKNQRFNLIYVDAFAGEGSFHLNAELYSDNYDDFRGLHDGSPRIALRVQDRPFDRFLFIEIDPKRSEALTELRRQYPQREITIRNEDANVVLPQFCESLQFSDRAVVFLDPFALTVSWSTIEAVAATKKIDCWFLFPLSAVARMMPTDESPTESWAIHLDEIFGAREHWSGLYRPSPQLSLFESDPTYERPGGSGPIADRYRERLESIFHTIAPTRRVLKNSRNSPLFELFFAASNSVGAGPAVRIADHILRNW